MSKKLTKPQKKALRILEAHPEVTFREFAQEMWGNPEMFQQAASLLYRLRGMGLAGWRNSGSKLWSVVGRGMVELRNLKEMSNEKEN